MQLRSIFSEGDAPRMKMCALMVLLSLSACGSDMHTENSELGKLETPSRADFPGVSDAMQMRCGTLDCHGQTSRNLRLFGHYGLRLFADADPVEPFMSTEEEYDASYASVVGLEPETMSKVVQKLSPVYDLTFVRKPRGLEKHKGGELMKQGDFLDRCLVGWLKSAFDPDACKEVTLEPKPEPDGGMQP